MLHTGLVSITFRNLSPKEIVDLVAKAGLEGIEWGGDIHVPHGDLKCAREVGAMTRDAGLAVPSYGSYYRIGEKDGASFSDVLATAVELGAPLVRVWSGSKGSADADEAYRESIVLEAQQIADEAAAAGIETSCEFHGGALTDTNESAERFYGEVGRDNAKAYWQPNANDVNYNVGGLEALLPWLAHIHAFNWNWGDAGFDRLPLGDAPDKWKRYLQVAASTGREHFVMLEYVKDDSPEAFLEDAATLKSWIEG